MVMDQELPMVDGNPELPMVDGSRNCLWLMDPGIAYG